MLVYEELLDINKLPTLPPPYEIYQFEPCKPAYFKIVSWKIGKMEIHPRYPGAPAVKLIPVVRLYVDPATKKYFPPYWDITPKRLTYQLAGLLTRGIPENMWLKIHRTAPGPAAHFEVSWVPGPEE